ncbi:MAG: alpha-beta hydrolase superfamily lysophospholipase [Gammaproteobacteria bacterium]|jgi:alpha-beta hydrolase superfamily lysophospholipase
MAFEKFDLQSNTDQLNLGACRWPLAPGTRAKALVVISHGMGEHAKRYDEFATSLNRAGFVVYAVDHRGHGASPGPRGFGDFGLGGWNALVDDLAQVVRYAQAENPHLNTALFGHSMGSFAAQQFLFNHHMLINAVILSGTAALDKLLDAMASAEESAEGLASFNAGFEPARTGYEWLSRDVNEVEKYVVDPFCGYDLSPESMMSLASQAAMMANSVEINKISKELPILLLAGDKDPVTGRLEFLKVLQQRYQNAGIKCIDTKFYPDGRHEMLNEINRQDVYVDIREWLTANL